MGRALEESTQSPLSGYGRGQYQNNPLTTFSCSHAPVSYQRASSLSTQLTGLHLQPGLTLYFYSYVWNDYQLPVYELKVKK